MSKVYVASGTPEFHTGMFVNGGQPNYAWRTSGPKFDVRHTAGPKRPILSLTERRKRACYGY